MSTLELIVQRRPSHNETTIGELSITGHTFTCFTCEDLNRFDAPKVPGKTCIPAGRYLVDMKTPSPKFNRRLMPRLVNVPGFIGILIHTGNSNGDTEGCILVGFKLVGDRIEESVLAFRALMSILEAAASTGREIWITIKNP